MNRACVLLTVALAAGVTLAGCGGGGGGSSAQSSPTAAAPVSITVGVIPIVDVAPIYLGVQQGYFKEQNLDVTLQLAQGGAAIIPAVVSGQYQFGFSNVVSEILAIDKGLKLKIVSQGAQASDKAETDYSAVLVKTGGAIKDCKGLEGKTIAVNTLKNIGDVTIKNVCEKQGANVSSFKFIEMNFPDMLPALLKGSIDAEWTVEPFVSLAKQGGATQLVANYQGTAPHLTVATYFASADYISQNPAVVKRFQTAIGKSLDYAGTHPDAVRAIVQNYAKVNAATAQAISLPYWSHDLNKPTIDQLSGLMQKYGLINNKPNISSLYAS